MSRAQTHAYTTRTWMQQRGRQIARLRQGSGRFIVVAEAAAVVVAAAADSFIDWHCRHRPEESVSGVRELCTDGASRFSWSWVRGRLPSTEGRESRPSPRATRDGQG